LGNILGVGGRGTDPVAGLLGQFVHPDLSDRHVVTDLLQHLTGHVAVGVLGRDPESRIEDVADLGNLRKWLGQTMHLVAAAQLKEPVAFQNRWLEKTTVLSSLGFVSERLVHPTWLLLRFRRGCPTEQRASGAPNQCEEYGLIVKDDVLLVTTGRGTLDRVIETASGNTTNFHGLTREPLAISVLEHGAMLAGVYFSFDGLLRNLRGANLPGGTTRHLAQLYEIALTLQTTDGDASGQFLLTR